MSLTVWEHLEKAKDVHTEWKEIAWVLWELKDVLEQIIPSEDVKSVRDFINGTWLSSNSLLSDDKFENIRVTINEILSHLWNFERRIPLLLIENFWVSFSWHSNLTTNYWDVSFGNSFTQDVSLSLWVINWLKDLNDELYLLRYSLWYIENDNDNKSLKNNIKTLTKSLFRITDIIRRFFLWDEWWKHIIDIPYTNLDTLRDLTNYYAESEKPSLQEYPEIWKKLLKRIKRWQLRSIPISKQLFSWLLFQTPKTKEVYTPNKSIQNFVIELLSDFLVSNFEEDWVWWWKKVRDLFIDLYKQLAWIRDDLEYILWHYQNYKRIYFSDFQRFLEEKDLSRTIEKQETLQPTLAITRLTSDIAEVIEQISSAWWLSPEIEETLKSKADEARIKRKIEEDTLTRSVSQ